MVAQYSGLNLIEVNHLDIIEYWVLKRDAWIHHLSQSEKGQEYLDNAWICEQTAPDRKRLRAQFGQKVAMDNGGE